MRTWSSTVNLPFPNGYTPTSSLKITRYNIDHFRNRGLGNRYSHQLDCRSQHHTVFTYIYKLILVFLHHEFSAQLTLKTMLCQRHNKNARQYHTISHSSILTTSSVRECSRNLVSTTFHLYLTTTEPNCGARNTSNLNTSEPYGNSFP
jgi:hypothetical protein